MFPIIRNTLNFMKSCATQTILSQPPQFLQPTTHQLIPNCGFKVKGKLRKRCKDCTMVRREERWYVLCKTHPRHKQMSMIKDPKNTWMLSHATQGFPRPW